VSRRTADEEPESIIEALVGEDDLSDLPAPFAERRAQDEGGRDVKGTLR
jgi:hypothetical protein